MQTESIYILDLILSSVMRCSCLYIVSSDLITRKRICLSLRSWNVTFMSPPQTDKRPSRTVKVSKLFFVHTLIKAVVSLSSVLQYDAVSYNLREHYTSTQWCWYTPLHPDCCWYTPGSYKSTSATVLCNCIATNTIWRANNATELYTDQKNRHLASI